MKNLMDEGRTAEILDVTTKCLQAWRSRGEGPKFIKIGRLVKYRMDDLLEYINNRVHFSTSD